MLDDACSEQAANLMAARTDTVFAPPPSLRAVRKRLDGLQVHCGSGERRAATTRPSWPTSNGARRGDVSDPELDYLDAMGSPDGRETILLSILSSGAHALRAARSSWSSAVGRLGCRRA